MTTIQETSHKTGPTLDQLETLHRSGYGVLPLPAGAKFPPPNGLTGNKGTDLTLAQIRHRYEGHEFGNVGVRLPQGVIGLDVDAYGDKQGATTWAQLCDAAQDAGTPMPCTVRITSRAEDDAVSGIRLFRAALPPGHEWIGGLSGLETIRYEHRYVVSPPSRHPLGRTYVAIDEATGESVESLPPVDDLPMLPPVVVEHLTKETAPQRGSGPAITTQEARKEPERGYAAPCKAVQERSTRARAQLASAVGGSRHDTAVRHVQAITRLHEQGHTGALAVLDTLREDFVTQVATGAEQRCTPHEAAYEYESAVQSAWHNVAAAPTPTHERGCCGHQSKEPAAWDGPAKESEGEEPEDKTTERKSVATVLVDLALAHYRLGITEDGEPFAVPLAPPRLVRQLRGTKGSLRTELAAAYFDSTGRAAPQAALADALAVIEGKCQTCTPEPLALRVAEYHGEHFLDLGDSTGRAVRIGRTGWAVVHEPPVLFRRTELTGSLPEPQHGGALEALWDLLNVHAEYRPLIVAWLVMAMTTDVPTPVLALHGEQGTGKSTMTKSVAGLIDPSPAQTRKPPRDPDAWVMMAQGSWVIAIDNLSGISHWLSDALCRAVTGDGDVRRRLYSDAGLSVFRFQRPVVVNGIDLGALRGDLVDRLLVCELSVIDSRSRQTDASLRRRWEDTHPAILGALLDCAVKVANVLPTVNLKHTPRMADFARTLAAVDQVLGTNGFGIYWQQFESMAADSVAGDPVLAAITRAVTDEWEGKAADLLARITPEDTSWRRPRDWPRGASDLTGLLKRNAPALRRIGWAVEHKQDAHTKVLRWLLSPPSNANKGNARAGEGVTATPATPASVDGLAGTAGTAWEESPPSLAPTSGPCPKCSTTFVRYGTEATASLCPTCTDEPMDSALPGMGFDSHPTCN